MATYPLTPRVRRRRLQVRQVILLGFGVVLAAVGLAACYPREAVTGVYSVNVNGSVGEITVRQSGPGDSAVYTATVTAPFKPSGFTCSLTAGTVVASFTGTAPNFTERYAKFNASTCVKVDDGYTAGAVATLNDDTSLTLGLASGTSVNAEAALLTRTGDGAWVTEPVAAGEYSVNVNGSIGAVDVHQSGADAAAVYTVTVTTAFKPSGFSCSLTPGTVIANFTGTGPNFAERYAKFNATTCAKVDDGYTAGSVALLNGDNSLVLGLVSGTSVNAHAELLTRTGDLTTVTTPITAGHYSVNVNGSIGAVDVHQSGSGASTVFTATVTTPFKPSGFSCSLTPGTVIANFTGTGPNFAERYAKFNATTCAKVDDGYTAGSVALLNGDNSLVLGLVSGTSVNAHAELLTRTGDLTTVTTPITAGHYSLNVNGSIGAVDVHQSGSGASTVFTATVTTPFKPSGFSCSLTPGTVIANFTGTGPNFAERYAKFNATTCAKVDDGYTAGSVALLNGDNSLVLGLVSGTSVNAHAELLTRTGDLTTVTTPITAGHYSVNVNGSIGAVDVHQSGSGASTVFTATVTTPFKPSGFSCSLTPGTVIANFTGTGPNFAETYAKFDSTCTKINDGYTAGRVALLNGDNTLILGLASGTSVNAHAELLYGRT